MQQKHLTILTCTVGGRFHVPVAPRFCAIRSSCYCRKVRDMQSVWCVTVHENCRDCGVQWTACHTHTVIGYLCYKCN